MSFDETNLVPNAGLLPAAVLAERIGLAELVDSRLHFVRHDANSGSKALTVVGSMRTGGDSIDDAMLRAGAASELFDATRAPSTIGSWLRAHKWSDVRQHGATSRELLKRLSGRCRPAADQPGRWSVRRGILTGGGGRRSGGSPWSRTGPGVLPRC